MAKAAHPLNLPSARSELPPNEGSNEFVSLSGKTRGVAFLSSRMPPRRSSALSMTAPAPPSGTTLEDLRRRILDIERPRLTARDGISEAHEGGRAGPRTAAWSLGAPEVDALLGANALDAAACHEIKPASGKAASRAAALAFALALARRRLDGAPRTGKGVPRILWCSSPHTTLDAGSLYPPGLARFGLDASSLLMVDARRDDDVLWALEEGLRSGSLVLAMGVLSAVDLTPARRLSLAAREGVTPLLMLTSARTAASAATATRWRINPVGSAAHCFDARAPGTARLAVQLDRCRSAPSATEAALTLEWSHEAYRFRLAAAVADRTAEAAPARRRAG